MIIFYKSICSIGKDKASTVKFETHIAIIFSTLCIKICFVNFFFITPDYVTVTMVHP